MKRIALIGVGLALLAGPAVAQCATAGLNTKCIYAGPRDDTRLPEPPETSARFTSARRNSPEATTRRFQTARKVKAPDPTFETGETLPANVMILMNPTRYGLPRPRDGWTYFSLDREIYRADLRTRVVLDFVNPHISRY